MFFASSKIYAHLTHSICFDVAVAVHVYMQFCVNTVGMMYQCVPSILVVL